MTDFVVAPEISCTLFQIDCVKCGMRIGGLSFPYIAPAEAAAISNRHRVQADHYGMFLVDQLHIHGHDE